MDTVKITVDHRLTSARTIQKVDEAIETLRGRPGIQITGWDTPAVRDPGQGN